MNHQIKLLAILALLSSSAFAAPSCSKVVLSVRPCLDYIQGKAKNPTPACCSGVKSVGGGVKSQADRTAVCNCLKTVLSSIGSYDKNTLPLLPKKCGSSISLPPIDSKTDCKKAMTHYGL